MRASIRQAGERTPWKAKNAGRGKEDTARFEASVGLGSEHEWGRDLTLDDGGSMRGGDTRGVGTVTMTCHKTSQDRGVFEPRVNCAGSPKSETCRAMLGSLFESSPAALVRQDTVVLNLLCAVALPGSEELDVAKCVARVNRLAAFVKGGIERSLHRSSADPDYGHCEPMWRMAHLVTMVKRDFGAMYNPELRQHSPTTGGAPATSSRDIFIHGLLDDNRKRRHGTCASIPVLITAVARRLGYPVSLAAAGRHVYARWHGHLAGFNIEASNPMGMTIPSDDEYWRDMAAATPAARQPLSAYYLRMLTPGEEFALFMKNRVEYLIEAARFEDTLVWAARALQFAPDDPEFPYLAHYALNEALICRLRRIHPETSIPDQADPRRFVFNVGDLLRPAERRHFLTIVAHYKEAAGELDSARRLYEDACCQSLGGSNEPRDLKRFLRKHGLDGNKTQLPPATGLDPPRMPELAGAILPAPVGATSRHEDPKQSFHAR
jgi:hypothetical protein